MLPIRDLNPTVTRPVVTILLIAACVVIFFYQAAIGLRGGDYAAQAFVYRHGLVPYEFSHRVRLSLSPADSLAGGHRLPLRPDRNLPLVETPVRGFRGALSLMIPPLLVSIFLHGSLLHVGFNMLFLWIFGNNVEDAMGHLRFLLFYLICGIAAGLVHLLTNLNSQLPTVGASGAIAGVMGAYIVLYPRARILTLVTLGFHISFTEIPACVFLGIWFLMQLLMAGGGGGVAWFAHIGGFLAGLFLVRMCVRYSPRSRGLREW
ncbi:MAG: rhomboid family intramembrane serine protease [Candidatus Aureabacteria bacterium]|nr:rhomboid family intramembrane serine protease [Candidatus Auribacterota bacterium]